MVKVRTNMQSPLRIGLSSGFKPSNNRLKTINAGESISQSHINNLVRTSVKNTLKPSSEYRIKQTEEGTMIKFNGITGYSGYGESPLTAKCTKVNKETRIYVTAGMVNMEVPKINGRYLDQPDTKGELPYLVTSGSGYICIQVNAENTKTFPSDNPQIVFHTGNLANAQGDTSFLIPIARVFVNGENTSFSVFSRGNIRVSRIKAGGNTAQWYWTTYGY